jgi:hypothetical protein
MGPMRSIGKGVLAQSCWINRGGKPRLRMNSVNKAERLPCLSALSRTLALPSAVREPPARRECVWETSARAGVFIAGTNEKVGKNGSNGTDYLGTLNH